MVKREPELNKIYRIECRIGHNTNEMLKDLQRQQELGKTELLEKLITEEYNRTIK